jgi:hypothetical protein
MDKEKLKKSFSHAALFLVFFSPVLAYLEIVFHGGNTLLFEDGLLQTFPFRAFMHNAFVNGFSPQWVPNSAFGFSLLAEGQNGICFPVTQIVYRLFSAETGWIVELLLLQLVSFSLCFAFLRHLKIKRIGSLFGAALYTFCDTAYIQSVLPSLSWNYALLPGIFLLCDNFVKGKSFYFVNLIFVFSLVFLIGHPVMIIYMGIVIFIYLVFLMTGSWSEQKDMRKIGRLSLILLGCIIATVIIASPQLLPMLQLYKFSARSAGPMESLDFLQNTLHVLPSWFPGSLFPVPILLGGVEFYANSIRFPIFALFLALVGLFTDASGRYRNFFFFLFVFSVLVSLGPYVGLWKVLHSPPILRYFRYPCRWVFFLPICLSYFCACGVEYMLSQPIVSSAASFFKKLRYVILAAAAVCAVYFIHNRHRFKQQLLKALEQSEFISIILIICAVGMIIAIFYSLRKDTIRNGTILGIVLTIISLSASLAFKIMDPMVIRSLETISWNTNRIPDKPQLYRTTATLSPWDLWTQNNIKSLCHFISNLPVLYGTLSTNYYFSFFPYWSANMSSWCNDALKGVSNKQIYLELCASNKLLIPEGLSYAEAAVPLESYKGKAYKEIKEYKNRGAIPRVSVVYSCRVLPDEDKLVAFMESPHFHPRRELAVFKRDAGAWNLGTDLHEQAVSSIAPEAKIVDERPDRIEIKLEPTPSRAAFLVLSDTYYPGWRALVDGVETKVLRVNYAFRGIKLPEGAKRVFFFFDPLIPDAVLPIPTCLLLAFGAAICIRYFFRHRVRK